VAQDRIHSDDSIYGQPRAIGDYAVLAGARLVALRRPTSPAHWGPLLLIENGRTGARQQVDLGWRMPCETSDLAIELASVHGEAMVRGIVPGLGI
jgi:hypothetical protein